MDVNQVWQEWEVEETPIGRGSYGVVYKAVRRDHGVESYAAIKVISIPADSSELDSLRSEGLDLNASRTYLQSVVNDFVGEIQLMESMKGIQNIVSVEDYKVFEKTDEVGWDIYIRMELLTPFSAYIAGRNLTESEIIKIGCDICTALEICGKRNIIHRDIKPENIFVNDFGHFKLGDFGIARKLENVTGGFSQKGTYNYMAPEVVNSNNYDARVDTYSLGIVLYRLLNGNRLPFLDSEKQLLNPNERRNAVDRRLRGEPIPAPCNASLALASVILRACAFEPVLRYSSAEEMKRALMSVENGNYASTYVEEAMPVFQETSQGSFDEPNQGGFRESVQEPTPTNGGKKRKRVLPKLLAAVCAILLVAGAAVFLVPRLTGTNGGTDSGQDSGYSDFDEKKIAAFLSEAEEYAKKEKYGEALERIKVGLAAYPDCKELKEKEKEYSEVYSAQQKEAVLSSAAAWADSGQYAEAMEVIQEAQKTNSDDADYLNAYNTYKKAYKAEIMDSANKLAASGDFVAAIARIEEARKVSGEDSDYQEAYNRYCKEYKAQIIAKADNLAEGGDYQGAVQTVNSAVSIIGEDAEISAKAVGYENSYVSQVIAKVDSMLALGQYKEAEACVKEGQKLFSNNALLREQLQKIENDKPKLLLEVCPPYEMYGVELPVSMTMAGEKYANGFMRNRNAYEHYIYFNLQGKYNTLQFDYGHIDGTSMDSYIMYVFIDGMLTETIELSSDQLVQSKTINLNGAKQLKFIFEDGWGGDYGFANMYVR